MVTVKDVIKEENIFTGKFEFCKTENDVIFTVHPGGKITSNGKDITNDDKSIADCVRFFATYLHKEDGQ